MQPGRAITLVMKAAEPHSGGADIGFVLAFRQPIDVERLYAAYTRLVEQQSALRSTLELDNRTRRYLWQPLSETRWRQLLAEDRRALAESHDLAELAATWRKLGDRFPLLLFRIDERRCYVSVQHAWTDGLGALRWIRALLRLYGGAEWAAPDDTPDPRSLGSDGARRRLTSLLWFLWFATRRFPRSHLRPTAVVDLTHGASPGQGNRQGYSLLRYELSRDELAAVYRRARQERLTLTQYFCGILSEVALEEAPPRSRVRIAIPVTVQRRSPRDAAGALAAATLNVSSLAFEIAAGKDWRAQIRREFRWLDRGIPAAYDRCLDALVGLLGDERALRLFGRHLALPHAHPTRGYLRQLTCIVSNLGIVEAPEVREHLDSLSFHAKAEILLMGLVTTNGRLRLDVIPPNHVYDPAEIARLMNRVVQRLGDGIPVGRSPCS